MSTYNLSSNYSQKNIYSKDPICVKDEVIKSSKEETNEKVVLIKLIIVNIKSSNQASNGSSLPTNKNQPNQQQPQQQPDLNYLMALSYVAISKPQLFSKNPILVEVSSI